MNHRLAAVALSALSLALAQCSGGSTEGASAVEIQTAEPLLPTVFPEVAIDTTAFEKSDGYYVLNWADLAIPDFRMEYSEEAESEVMIPIFSPQVRYLNGKQVIIKGFFFPFEESVEEAYYVLSQFPFSQCFFCGAAGPESVMDLIPKSKFPRLKMDDHRAFRGRLRLNDSDFLYLNYILEEAELVK
jgi:hypothetical protein